MSTWTKRPKKELSINGNGKLTPTQQKIYNVLSDGLPHDKAELHACLWDELSAGGAVPVHITYLRKHLKAKGLGIVCEFARRRKFYRLVRFVAKAAD